MSPARHQPPEGRPLQAAQHHYVAQSQLLHCGEQFRLVRADHAELGAGTSCVQLRIGEDGREQSEPAEEWESKTKTKN